MKRKIIVNKKETNYSIDENWTVFNDKLNRALKGRVSASGYVDYGLRIDGKLKCFRAHRLVAQAFLDNPNDYDVVNHIDGNKLNNNINNLEWVSQKENVNHAYANNLISKSTYLKYDGDESGETWERFLDSQYFISNLGRVRNEITKRLLKGKTDTGYVRYELNIHGKRKTYLGHRLVYYAFNKNSFDITDTKQVINHKNGDKTDNKLDNLEKLSQQENVNKAYYEAKTNKRMKTVYQYALNGELIKIYPSANQAARETNIRQGLISSACLRKAHLMDIFGDMRRTFRDYNSPSLMLGWLDSPDYNMQMDCESDSSTAVQQSCCVIR